jgi:hypothetical protein
VFRAANPCVLRETETTKCKLGTPAMKVSDHPFLSWSQDLTMDDFPCNISFRPDQTFVLHYSTYDSWGGDTWCFHGTYADDGSTLRLKFETDYCDRTPYRLDPPLHFETTYTFIGPQVEFTVTPIAAFLHRVPRNPIRFFWRDFITSEDD